MMELKDTVDMMVSDDYRERFRAEYLQLCIRKRKLADLLKRWERGELDFEPSCPFKVLMSQYRHMEDYGRLLENRAEIEGIDLKWKVQR